MNVRIAGYVPSFHGSRLYFDVRILNNYLFLKNVILFNYERENVEFNKLENTTVNQFNNLHIFIEIILYFSILHFRLISPRVEF